MKLIVLHTLTSLLTPSLTQGTERAISILA